MLLCVFARLGSLRLVSLRDSVFAHLVLYGYCAPPALLAVFLPLPALTGPGVFSSSLLALVPLHSCSTFSSHSRLRFPVFARRSRGLHFTVRPPCFRACLPFLLFRRSCCPPLLFALPSFGDVHPYPRFLLCALAYCICLLAPPLCLCWVLVSFFLRFFWPPLSPEAPDCFVRYRPLSSAPFFCLAAHIMLEVPSAVPLLLQTIPASFPYFRFFSVICLVWQGPFPLLVSCVCPWLLLTLLSPIYYRFFHTCSV